MTIAYYSTPIDRHSGRNDLVELNSIQISLKILFKKWSKKLKVLLRWKIRKNIKVRAWK